MQLYNTLGNQTQRFAPRPGRPVGVYVCGITPYDTTHLGHAFLYVSFDVLIRHLESKHWPVRYIQNVTDIDDDILRKAGETGENWRALGNAWTRRFIDDQTALNIRPPDAYPRATEEIDTIRGMTAMLLEKGLAYVRDGNVYFRVGRDSDYGKLSCLTASEMIPISAERGANPTDPRKENPLDFILWQAQAPGEPAWDSPWGPGRPGWHIECSAMSLHHLGHIVDIHGGGSDLIYPHHESEIAQSEGYSGEGPFARFWVHAGMLRYEGEKMSKSLGNMVFVRDLLKTYPADAIRLALLVHRYREAWEYHDADLDRATALSARLNAAVQTIAPTLVGARDADAVAHFTAALDDDLDTPTAIQVLEALIGDVETGRASSDTLRQLGGTLGLSFGAPPEPRVVEGWNTLRRRFED